MKGYLTFSVVAHGMMLAALMVVGTLLSKPRMSYYAVDLMSSMPAGGGPSPAPSVSPVAVPAPPAPKVSVPKVAPPAPRAPEEELPDQDTIRMLAKLKKKRLNQAKAVRESGTSDREDRAERMDSGSSASGSTGHGAGAGGAGGSGIVAEAGIAFPYPWYLKAIADRLDKQWHPPQEYAPDTMCQVTFVISRSGQVTGSQVSKSSGDSLYDQLALRAVLYANPLPPLPNGFPDETLKVHMKFVGRRI